jgi:hypothetical protein
MQIHQQRLFRDDFVADERKPALPAKSMKAGAIT